VNEKESTRSSVENTHAELSEFRRVLDGNLLALDGLSHALAAEMRHGLSYLRGQSSVLFASFVSVVIPITYFVVFVALRELRG